MPAMTLKEWIKVYKMHRVNAQQARIFCIQMWFVEGLLVAYQVWVEKSNFISDETC